MNPCLRLMLAGAMALALTLAAAAILWLAGRWERRGLT